MSTQYNFVEIENVNKIWAIGSIHSNLKSLKLIKSHIVSNFEKNDVLIFLGNIIGLGEKAKESLSEVIDLRFNLMAKNFIKPNKERKRDWNKFNKKLPGSFIVLYISIQ